MQHNQASQQDARGLTSHFPDPQSSTMPTNSFLATRFRPVDVGWIHLGYDKTPRDILEWTPQGVHGNLHWASRRDFYLKHLMRSIECTSEEFHQRKYVAKIDTFEGSIALDTEVGFGSAICEVIRDITARKSLGEIEERKKGARYAKRPFEPTILIICTAEQYEYYNKQGWEDYVDHAYKSQQMWNWKDNAAMDTRDTNMTDAPCHRESNQVNEPDTDDSTVSDESTDDDEPLILKLQPRQIEPLPTSIPVPEGHHWPVHSDGVNAHVVFLNQAKDLYERISPRLCDSDRVLFFNLLPLLKFMPTRKRYISAHTLARSFEVDSSFIRLYFLMIVFGEEKVKESEWAVTRLKQCYPNWELSLQSDPPVIRSVTFREDVARECQVVQDTGLNQQIKAYVDERLKNLMDLYESRVSYLEKTVAVISSQLESAKARSSLENRLAAIENSSVNFASVTRRIQEIENRLKRRDSRAQPFLAASSPGPQASIEKRSNERGPTLSELHRPAARQSGVVMGPIVNLSERRRPSGIADEQNQVQILR